MLLELGSLAKADFYVACLAWNSLDQLPTALLRPARAEIEAVNVGPEPAAARTGGVTNRPPSQREGSFDLFAAGNDTEQSRVGGLARILKTTLLDRLK